MVTRGELYDNLWSAYKNAFPNHPKSNLQKEFHAEWNTMKVEYGDIKDLEREVQAKIRSLQTKAIVKKSTNILNFFKITNKPSEHATTSCPQPNSEKSSEHLKTDIKNDNIERQSTTGDKKVSCNIDVDSHEKGGAETETKTADIAETNCSHTPSQDQSKNRIDTLKSQIVNLTKVKDIGFANVETESHIKKLRKDLATEEKALRRKISDAVRKRKSRKLQGLKLKEICQKYPEVHENLKCRSAVIGRPRLEVDQPELLTAMIEIATHGGAADPRRRTELIRSCKTLADLTQELQNDGFKVSKSGVYLRLIPRRSNTEEGKRHVKTVPVKLCRPEADHHAKHPDGPFCHATIRALKTLESVLGPDETAFLSVDDKSRVPIGLTAAKKQAPLLLHLQYKVSLPDHDWMIADRHKLIPSVNAGVVIKPDNEGCPNSVSYSGPTYVAIRSGKHCSSTAETHALDLERALNLDSFAPLVKQVDGSMKPVMIITTDGGPDENPRYTRVISCAIQHFKNFNLDALFIATNAPGRSAVNRVERRMSVFSNEMTGLILPHDHFGTHLDSSNKTIDTELELKNFAFAAGVLEEVWSRVVIDGYPVVAEYIHPKDILPVETPDLGWYSKHVRESQYFLQIVKCDDEKCCGPWRSSLRLLLKSRFLPPPMPIKQSPSGLHIPPFDENNRKFCPLLLQLSLGIQPEHKDFLEIPYDMYCPSVQSRLLDRICSKCGLYHASIKSVKSHRRTHGKEKNIKKIKPAKVIFVRKTEVTNELLCLIKDETTGAENVEWIEEEDVGSDERPPPVLETADALPIITSFPEWLTSLWTQELA